MSYDALVQRARNDIVQLALELNVDDLVFVDCDVDWTPKDFFRLLNHDADVVGGVYPKKGDDEQYPVKIDMSTILNTGEDLVEVEGLPMGFTRITKRALQKVYNVSKEYKEQHKEKSARMVFDININNDGYLVSEDIAFCEKWKSLGEKVYLDPSINLSHVGTKRWNGDFLKYIERIRK
jgi:choline kinase